MRLYRKRPVTVHAMQFAGGIDSYLEIVESLRELNVTVADELRFTTPILLVPTLEGTMAANPGDWIVVGVQGEVYPVKPDIFAAIYDEVNA